MFLNKKNKRTLLQLRNTVDEDSQKKRPWEIFDANLGTDGSQVCDLDFSTFEFVQMNFDCGHENKNYVVNLQISFQDSNEEGHGDNFHKQLGSSKVL